MTVIELSDEQAMALKAKAAAAGLTLEAWLKQLAGVTETEPGLKSGVDIRDRRSYIRYCGKRGEERRRP